ncbi:hypothetical protein Ciccas_012824, partial [Cichlidogyrus casuarinus]
HRGQRRPVVNSPKKELPKPKIISQESVSSQSPIKQSAIQKSPQPSTPKKTRTNRKSKEIDAKDRSSDTLVSSGTLPAEADSQFENVSPVVSPKKHEYLSPSNVPISQVYNQDENEIEVDRVQEQPPLPSAYQPLQSPEKSVSGVHDDVLRDLLFQINCTGRVPSPIKRIICKPGEVGDSEEQKVQVKCDPKIDEVLNRIWSDGFVNKELEIKDQFLAATGLMRHGVGDVLRKRREYISKELSRSVVGRLRPNPRPRRFSDMIGQQQAISNGLFVTSRAGNKPNHLSVAQITATKKLNTAKNRSAHVQLIKNRRRKLSTVRKQISETGSNSENLRRSRRRPGLTQHIDWKFCYSEADDMVLKRSKQKDPNINLFISEEDEEFDYDEGTRYPKKKSSKKPNLCAQRKRPAYEEQFYDWDSEEESFDSHSLLNKHAQQKHRSKYHAEVDSEEDYESNENSSLERFNMALERRPPICGRFFSSKGKSFASGNLEKSPRRLRKNRRLTLLDKLILGLHCTIAQNGEKIHIKQLHQADLNILTQRTFKTGFVIQSLALKKNPLTQEAEYNVVLTCYKEEASKEVPKYEKSPKKSLSFYDDKMRSIYLRKKLKKQFQNKLRSARPPKSQLLQSRYQEELQQRGTTVLQHRRSKSLDRDCKPFELNKLRKVLSDSELCKQRRESVLRNVKRMETKCAENAAAQVMKIMRRIKASKVLSEENMELDSPESDYELDKLPWKPNNNINRKKTLYPDADASRGSKRQKLVTDSAPVKDTLDLESKRFSVSCSLRDLCALFAQSQSLPRAARINHTSIISKLSVCVYIRALIKSSPILEQI